MSQRQKNMVMIGAGRINNTINENAKAPGTIKGQQQQVQSNATTTTTTTSSKIRTGSFIGAGDGFHNAEGLTKVIPLGQGSSVIRLENFKSTNGPNVHLYLSTDKAASNFIDLGRLKANNGNQNYNIPDGTNLSKYDMVLIWCKDFSVLFGSTCNRMETNIYYCQQQPFLLYVAYFPCSSYPCWELNDVSHSSHLKELFVDI